MNRRSAPLLRRLLLTAAALIVALGILVAGVALFVHPDPITAFRYELAHGNVDVRGEPLPMYWSLRTHDRDGWQRLQLEGGTGRYVPEQIRVVDAAAVVIVEGPPQLMERGRSVGVCNTHEVLGHVWWARDLDPDVIASVTRDDGRYRVEARLPDGWRRVRLYDTGCRIRDVGRG